MKATAIHSLVALSLILSIITQSAALTRQAAGIENEERKVRLLGSPSGKIVEETTCNANGFCFFNDGINSWCITPQTPMLRVGWLTEQLFSQYLGVNYWQVRLKPYVTSYFSVVQKIKFGDIDRGTTLSNTLYLDLSKFMTNIFGEMQIYSNGYVCFNAGYQI